MVNNRAFRGNPLHRQTFSTARPGLPMTTPSWLLPRRTFLKSASACIALPFLDAMVPPNPLGDPVKRAAGKPPVRLGWFYAPNGIVMDNWKPTTAGRDFALPPILATLAPVRERLVVISDLAAEHCEGEGAGHEPSTGGFLTGRKCKHSEEPVAGGISIDQLAAKRLIDQTPIDALTLGIDPGMRGDHGYSGTYLSRMSWRSPTSPAALELNPKELFDRLFGKRTLAAPDWEARARPKAKPVKTDIDSQLGASVLDLVREDARRVLGGLGSNDRAKMEGYLDGIRGIEKRLDLAAEDETPQRADGGVPPDLMVPGRPGRPAVYADHVNLMLDILVLAYWTDTTRVGTFLFSNEKSTRSYPEIGAPGSHHSTSHHGKKTENLAELTRINTHHAGLFARMLKQMDKLKEGDGTLLDNVALLYGSGISDSNRHNHDDLPIMLCGGGGGAIRGGEHRVMGRKTPLCNLFLDMMTMAGLPLERFGDSTGRILTA